jgi:hypothetical protein
MMPCKLQASPSVLNVKNLNNHTEFVPVAVLIKEKRSSEATTREFSD